MNKQILRVLIELENTDLDVLNDKNIEKNIQLCWTCQMS